MDNLDNKENEALWTDNPQNGWWSQDELIERYKNQINWSKQEAERLSQLSFDTAVKSVWYDADYLLELHDKDPKLANKVAKEFWYSDYDDAKSTMSWWEEKKESNLFTEDDFDAMYQKRRDKEVHEKSLENAKTKISKTSNSEEVRKQFEKLVKWRQLNDEEATKFVEMANLYVNKDSLLWSKRWQSLEMLSSNWLWNSKKQDTEAKYIVKWGKYVLKSNK